ncbi:desmop [Alphabaculovirus alterspexiguae]|uniref:Desmop n=1 Tax=Spodoptera exigua multiple nucleopolyhedrovirus TaxID=10454 RepID=A0A3G2JTT3_9ABAC|nr:desmop [Spodoptera exigua multiple nucleopolyhedrovirus]AYN45041.1 desmop [Spodoptera exigua multiple nucleopolyhedrovirus]
MSSDRYRPKYKNTDVSASTVQNLLQTINNMSQRCRGQANTEDVIQRVRSIILLHRPHLASRIDLQLPELTMEAFMPNSSNVNQITHNFNYKYDYNTNVPGAYNPFFPAAAPQQYTPPNNLSSSTTPLQSFTINAAAPAADTSSVAAPETTSTTRVVTAPLAIEPEDLNNLNTLYVNAQRSPNVAIYKQLLRQLVYIVRKYVRYEQISLSLELMENFDSFQNNNLNELLRCIERETRWSIPNSSNVCRLISIIVSAYCRLVTKITQRDIIMSTIKTEDRLLTIVGEVEQNVTDAMNSLMQAKVTADSAQVTSEQINMLNARLQEQDNKLLQYQTQLTASQQQLASTESRTLVFGNAFGKLQTHFYPNIQTNIDVSGDNVDDFTNKIIEYVSRLQSEKSTVSQQNNSYAQLEQQSTERINALEKQVNVYESEIAGMRLQLNNFEDIQSQLRASQNKNQSLQDQLASQNEKYNDLQEKYTELKRETRKPLHKVKPTVRKSGDTYRKKIKNKQIAKLLESQQTLINERQNASSIIKDLKERYMSNIEKNDEAVRQIYENLQDTKARIETLAGNQAALTATDLKILNTKSVQALSDKVSKLTAENIAVKEICNTELQKQSNELKDRLEVSKNDIDSRIEKLINQIEPINNRILETAQEVKEMEVRYEQLARNNANIKTTMKK